MKANYYQAFCGNCMEHLKFVVSTNKVKHFLKNGLVAPLVYGITNILARNLFFFFLQQNQSRALFFQLHIQGYFMRWL